MDTVLNVYIHFWSTSTLIINTEESVNLITTNTVLEIYI